MINSEKQAEQLAQQLSDYVGGGPAQTQVNIKVVRLMEDKFQIELHPADENDGSTFFHSRQLVDFARGHGLNELVTIGSFAGSKIIVGVLF